MQSPTTSLNMYVSEIANYFIHEKEMRQEFQKENILSSRRKLRKNLPRTVKDETPRSRLCTRPARVIDGVVVLAKMVAIFLQ